MFLELLAVCLHQSYVAQGQSISHDAKSTALKAQSETRHLKNRIQILEETVDRLCLATIALGEIVQGRLNVSQAEIDAKIQEIDLRDGTLDGRFRSNRSECTKCHHANSGNRRKCLYCGESLGSTPKES